MTAVATISTSRHVLSQRRGTGIIFSVPPHPADHDCDSLVPVKYGFCLIKGQAKYLDYQTFLDQVLGTWSQVVPVPAYIRLIISIFAIENSPYRYCKTAWQPVLRQGTLVLVESSR